jgi:hypothetical protein
LRPETFDCDGIRLMLTHPEKPGEKLRLGDLFQFDTEAPMCEFRP